MFFGKVRIRVSDTYRIRYPYRYPCNIDWDYPDEWSGIATDKVLAVALSILLFGKREHFHRQVPALNYLSYHANVFLAEIRKRNCESIQSRYGMRISHEHVTHSLKNTKDILKH